MEKCWASTCNSAVKRYDYISAAMPSEGILRSRACRARLGRDGVVIVRNLEQEAIYSFTRQRAEKTQCLGGEMSVLASVELARG